MNAVAALLNDPNRFIRGRAIFLLYQLGPEGQKRAGTPESQTDPALKIAAYRAMRRAGLDVLPVAAKLAKDADRASAARSRSRCATCRRRSRWPILVDSRTATTARTAATSRRSAPARPARKRRSTIGCARDLGATRDPLDVAAGVRAARVAPARAGRGAGPADAGQVGEAVADRSQAGARHARVRRRSGGIEGDAHARRARQRAQEPVATWWLLNRMSSTWTDHRLRPALKTAGIYDPDTITLREAAVPRRPRPDLPELVVEDDREDDRRCRRAARRRRPAA